MKLRKDPDLVVRNGKPVAVILPIKEYEALLELADDANDIRWLEEHRDRKVEPLIPIEDVKRRLQKRSPKRR